MLVGFTQTFVSRWSSFLMASIPRKGNFPSTSHSIVKFKTRDNCSEFRESLSLKPNYVGMLSCRHQNDGKKMAYPCC